MGHVTAKKRREGTTTKAHPPRGGAAKPGVSMRRPGSRRSPNVRHTNIRPPSGSGDRNIERRRLLRGDCDRKPGIAPCARNTGSQDASTGTVGQGSGSQPTCRGQARVRRPRPQVAALPSCAPTLGQCRSARRTPTHVEQAYSRWPAFDRTPLDPGGRRYKQRAEVEQRRRRELWEWLRLAIPNRHRPRWRTHSR